MQHIVGMQVGKRRRNVLRNERVQPKAQPSEEASAKPRIALQVAEVCRATTQAAHSEPGTAHPRGEQHSAQVGRAVQAELLPQPAAVDGIVNGAAVAVLQQTGGDGTIRMTQLMELE